MSAQNQTRFSAERFLLQAASELNATPPIFDCRSLRIGDQIVYFVAVFFLGNLAVNSDVQLNVARTRASEDFVRKHGRRLNMVTGYEEAQRALYLQLMGTPEMETQNHESTLGNPPVPSVPDISSQIKIKLPKNILDNEFPLSIIPIAQEMLPGENSSAEFRSLKNEDDKQVPRSKTKRASLLKRVQNLLMTLRHRILGDNKSFASPIRANEHTLEQIEHLLPELTQAVGEETSEKPANFIEPAPHAKEGRQ